MIAIRIFQTAFSFMPSEMFFPFLSHITDYSGLNLNQYGVASPCRTICTVCGFVALSRFLLIHYKSYSP
ncbi:hypothetical protein A6J53_14580 [Neisseria meningitidis]|nr:hypothetical protein A6J53_14580 [Neisseria meningitidis]